MAKQKQTYYTKDWENPTLSKLHLEVSKWVSGTSGSTVFGYRVCPASKHKKLGNMGINALRKHQETNGHKKCIKRNEEKGLVQPSVAAFPLTSGTAPTSDVDPAPTSDASDPAICSVLTSATSSTPSAVNKVFQLPSVQVKRTTILLAIKSAMSHLSQRCIESLIELFPILFPDSGIPAKIKLKRTKLYRLHNPIWTSCLL